MQVMMIDVRGVSVLQGVRDGRECAFDFIGHRGFALWKAFAYALFRNILCHQVAACYRLPILGEQAVVEAFADVAMLQFFEELRAREKRLLLLVAGKRRMEDMDGAVVFRASLLFAQVDRLDRTTA